MPFRMEKGVLKILLITNRSGKRWIIPKGIIEEGHTPKETVRQEAFEEAGIRGAIHPEPVGEYRYKKWEGICLVTIFLMKVDDVSEAWPESGFRRRQWMNWDQAVNKLDERIPRTLLQTLHERLEKMKEASIHGVRVNGG